jgi:hypothetical protein
MSKPKKQVFVLGAGFTRAFFCDSPLLTDDYDANELLGKFKDFPHAHKILELEKSQNTDCKINIERLMTRVSGLMPYDFVGGKVVFIGYSMPVTDIAASFLFTEAGFPVSGMTVVDKAEDGEDNKKQKIIATYQNIFAKITEDQFDFSGAEQWVRNILKR